MVRLKSFCLWLLKIHILFLLERIIKQIDGVAMGSALGTTLANAFLVYILVMSTYPLL